MKKIVSLIGLGVISLTAACLAVFCGCGTDVQEDEQIVSDNWFTARVVYDECYITSVGEDAIIEGKICIPNDFYGYKVVGIDNLLSDDANTEMSSEITEVQISSTVKYIGESAFFGLQNLSKITYNEQNNVEKIGAQAFGNCSSLTSFEIGSKVNYIGEGAFCGCSGLKEVIIWNTDKVIEAGGVVFDDDAYCDIYISEHLIDGYQAVRVWGPIKPQLKTLPVTISLVDGDTSLSYTNETAWGKKLDGMPIPEKEGYEFIGWFKNQNAEGEKLADGVINTEVEDFTLFANWKAIAYEIVYDLDGGINKAENPKEYTVDQKVYLVNPFKIGNQFIGWESEGEMLGRNLSFKGKTGTLNLKAVWRPKTLSVSFNSAGTEKYPAGNIESATVEFGQDDYKFQIPERERFRFIGWYIGDMAYTDADGNAVRKWDKLEATELRAKWENESFAARRDGTGNVFFSGASQTDEELDVTHFVRANDNDGLFETFQQYYGVENKIARSFYYLNDDGDESDKFRLIDIIQTVLKNNETLEFYANYKKEVHVLFFSSNTQNISVPAIEVESGSDISEELAKRTLTREGYIFGGWKIVASPDRKSLKGALLGYTMPDCSAGQINSDFKVEAIWI